MYGIKVFSCLKYNLNNVHIHLCLYTYILSSDNFEQLLFYNFKQTIQENWAHLSTTNRSLACLNADYLKKISQYP